MGRFFVIFNIDFQFKDSVKYCMGVIDVAVVAVYKGVAKCLWQRCQDVFK